MTYREKKSFYFGRFPQAVGCNSPSALKKRKKTPRSLKDFEVFAFGAAIQIRTGDLILTKDALYQLSYSSKWRPGSGSNRRPPA